MDQQYYFSVMSLGVALLTGGVAGGICGALWQSRKRSQASSSASSTSSTSSISSSAVASSAVLAFRPALDSTRDALYLLKAVPVEGSRALRFVIEDCNDAAAQQAGIEAAKMIGRPLHAFFPSLNATRLDPLLLDAHRHGHADAELGPVMGNGGSERADGPWWEISATRSHAGIAVTMRDITEMKWKEHQLKAMAVTDALTLLPNRHWLKQHLPDAVQTAAAKRQRVALMFLDLDDFKKINDSWGHQAGDEYLMAVATALRQSVRVDDTVIRLAGDEFTILIEHVGDASAVQAIAAKVQERMAHIDCEAVRRGFQPRVSIGSAMYPDDVDTDAALMQAADIAMYAAKEAGKGRLCMYTAELAHKIQSRLQLEQSLRCAIDRDEFFLAFQPRVSARSGALVCVEALLRWRHPQRGLISPTEFIGLAEQSDLIGVIGAWVVTEACGRLAGWRERGQPLVPVAINVSARQLRNDHFRRHVQAELARFAIAPYLLAIELTESAMMGGDAAVKAELHELRTMGIELHIDDFGVGYASLSRLHSLDVDAIKIDRSFVQGLGVRDEARKLCEVVIQMGKAMGFRVVAEGVETREQLRELQLMRCDEVQGYYVSRPVEADAVPALQATRSFFDPVFPVVQRVVNTRRTCT